MCSCWMRLQVSLVHKCCKVSSLCNRLLACSIVAHYVNCMSVSTHPVLGLSLMSLIVSSAQAEPMHQRDLRDLVGW